MIEIDRVWKSYGDNTVLEDISLTVKEGEFVTMVGASGCGKSTFLNLLLGTQTVSRGELRLDGQPIVAEPGPDRGIVFQQYSVFPHMTVLDNVMAAPALAQKGITGHLFGAARASAKREAEAMLERVGLAASAQQYPSSLSGGMRQRLAIAQALTAKPRILLLDEPFGALDPGIRNDMHVLLRDLWRSLGLTVFMVTHDLKEGFSLGSRLWVFDKRRHDPHAPNAYGAQVTYDLPLSKMSEESYMQTLQGLGSSSLLN
jgi:NitT/TauT family transport system ATP-binding protein